MARADVTQRSERKEKVVHSEPTVSVSKGSLCITMTTGDEKGHCITVSLHAREIAALWPELLQSALDVKPIKLA